MRDEVKMDANRLIAEVYKRPALWNQRHISYHNREVTNRVWMEIAAIFNLPSTCHVNTPCLRLVPRDRTTVIACTLARDNALPFAHASPVRATFSSSETERVVRRDRGDRHTEMSLTPSREKLATARLMNYYESSRLPIRIDCLGNT